MSLWSRIRNVARGDRMNRELDEELEAHVQDAIASGRDPAEARRALGAALKQREASRDVKLIPWLDSLRADAQFGWRRLAKSKVTTAAAILSLALAIGACTAAFRLIDAVLLRPLPVANPQELYVVNFEGADPTGKLAVWDSCSYPMFLQWRAALRGEAEIFAVSSASRTDLTYATDNEMEKAYRGYVSGWMFGSFGLKPAAGRLLTEDDDPQLGARANAVFSYDYWKRRFGADPSVVGRHVTIGSDSYEIVGVSPRGFTGTEPGISTDVFVPATMSPWAARNDSTWFRTLVRVRPGQTLAPMADQLLAIYKADETERSKSWSSIDRQLFLELLPKIKLLLAPAASGASALQKNYGPALMALGIFVALVLLIACANVANLLTAQAAARAREMALRISLGAARARLVQLVLVESALLAIAAAALGAVFAWWAAPFVVARINPPDAPVHLALSADWRVVGFGLALTFLVTLLFGLAPALRASGTKPLEAIKGAMDPHSRRRAMHVLIGAQTAFCFVVLLFSGLFIATFQRLSHKPIGFNPDGILTLDTVSKPAQPQVYWNQVADQLRATPGVEETAIAGWPLLTGAGWNGFIYIGGKPANSTLTNFLAVSPGFLDLMRIPLIEGRDLRPTDNFRGAVIVNETFAQVYFPGVDPVGKSFERDQDTGVTSAMQIVGVAGDTLYRNTREQVQPLIFVSLTSLDNSGAPKPARSETIFVRTASANPLAMAMTMRQGVAKARPGFRVSNISTQREIVDANNLRERLLAMLAAFFGAVAVLLAGIGLYGVLHYSVVERRREIGIRMAIGARAANIARLVTRELFLVVGAGAMAGLVVALASARYVASLLFDVKATDISMIAVPAVTIGLAALLAAVPGVIRAVQVDPAKTLRSE